MTKFLKRLYSFKSYSFLIGLVILLLVLVVYFFNQGYYIGRNPFPSGDEPDYLVGAMKIDQYGGGSKFISYLVTGSYTESRKHPFYMFLLSFFESKGLEFFVYSKYFNFFTGAILLSLSFFALKRMFNYLASLYFVFILALNEQILSETSLVVPDNLMMLLVLLTCYFYYLGFEAKEKKRTYFWKKRTYFWVFGSIFSALTYLTKPNGIFLISSFCLASIILLKKSIFRSKSFYVAIITFLLIVSPLLVRNIKLYGNPFYNNNVSLLWIENRQVRRAPDFEQKPPSIKSYLSNKSVLEEVKLYGENFVKMASNLSMLVLYGNWRWRYSFPLFLLTILAILVDGKKNRKVFLGVFFAISYLFYAYNFRVSPHYRHLMPITFIPIGFISVFAKNFSDKFFRKYARVFYTALLGLVIGLGLYFSFNKLYYEERLTFRVFEGQVDIPEVHIAVRDWLTSNVNTGDIYVMGLDDNFTFMWYADIKGKRIIQPYFESFDEFSKFLIDNRVKYVVLGGQSVNSFPEIYENYFIRRKNTPDYIYKVNGDPVGWKQVYQHPYANERSFKALIYSVENLWRN